MQKEIKMLVSYNEWLLEEASKQKFKSKKSKIHGTGIVANDEIMPDETICLIRGNLSNLDDIEKKIKKGEERRHDPFQIDKDVYLDLFKPYLHFNHSCDPNAGIKNDSELFAIKHIHPGDEVTYDYSTVSWEDEDRIPKKNRFSMPCKCGCKNCRGMIRDFPFLDDKIKNKYMNLGALPKFILTMLDGGLLSLEEWSKSNSQPSFKTLEKNKVDLKPEEREKTMSAKAIWNHGLKGQPSPAVWKSEINGKTWYVTNTHRAFQAKPTLKAAIKAYHDFIKGTA